ncbi:hypothetical protein ElyMa_003423300 [Elysia marginata]|uniref:Uncharacterized protein n=1 Tax=Elysia marginata TaxID=1093978 RepID=A0AAV4JTN8_9GAST|nr:hypothetical protein ElyMa_003423300 [Elysia marginata]
MPHIDEAVAMLSDALHKLMRLLARLVREDGTGNVAADAGDQQVPVSSLLQDMVTTGLAYHLRPPLSSGQDPLALCVCPNCQRVVCVMPVVDTSSCGGFCARGKHVG